MIHSNRVGFEDGLHFWGGSTVFDPNGELLVKAPLDDEALTYCEIDLNQLHRTRGARLPLLRDERTALVQRELTRILRRDDSPLRQVTEENMNGLDINTDLARSNSDRLHPQ